MSNAASSRSCTLCKQSNVWRIQLRQCEHFVCVACALLHLRYWISSKSKARIKCPKRSCPIRVHENDIDALLDPQNDDLNVYIGRAQREWLLYQHRKNVIQYAFGGEVKQCPLCKSVYTEYDGCHYVQCVNVRCRQYFCWECGQPIDSFQHFASAKCKVGWDDIWKLCYLLRFLFYTEGCILVLFAPFVLPALSYILPLIIVLLFAYYGTESIRAMLRQMDYTPIAITAAAAVSFPVLLIVGLPLAIGSFLIIIPIELALIFLIAVKNLPFVGKVFDMIYCAEMVAGCLGLDNWRTLLRDSSEARRLNEVQLKQLELEKSERPLGEEQQVGEQGSSAIDGGTSASQSAATPSTPVDKVKGIAQGLPIVGGFVSKLPGVK